jgi:large subunit ribosomal protein L18
MGTATEHKLELRIRRHKRIRRRLAGTAARPRLAVFRSNKHISAQIIDDATGHTLVSASTIESDLRGSTGGTIDAAKTIGELVASRAKSAGINTVVFDRGGFTYHGRVAALADAARAEGLEF